MKNTKTKQAVKKMIAYHVRGGEPNNYYECVENKQGYCTMKLIGGTMAIQGWAGEFSVTMIEEDAK